MNSWSLSTPLILSILVLIPALISDLRHHRIPNILCLSGFLAAIALHGFLSGWSGTLSSLSAGLLLLVMTFPFFALGWMGAGDVKVIAAVGAITGTVGAALSTLLMIVLAGAFAGLVLLAWQKGLKDLAKWLGATLVLSAIARRPTMAATPEDKPSREFPYAVAIAAGTALSAAMGNF